MDYSYLTPPNLGQVHHAVLLQTISEYRQAATILARNSTVQSEELRTHLLAAVEYLEAEIARRQKAKARTAQADFYQP